MRLAIASGKGGTGKTTLAVALATLLEGCCLLDADVEEPNAQLFVRGTESSRSEVALPVPKIDPGICTACGDCIRFCRFNALALAGQTVLLFDELCHGCGGCAIVCPTPIRPVTASLSGGGYTGEEMMEYLDNLTLQDILDRYGGHVPLDFSI